MASNRPNHPSNQPPSTGSTHSESQQQDRRGLGSSASNEDTNNPKESNNHDKSKATTSDSHPERSDSTQAINLDALQSGDGTICARGVSVVGSSFVYKDGQWFTVSNGHQSGQQQAGTPGSTCRNAHDNIHIRDRPLGRGANSGGCSDGGYITLNNDRLYVAGGRAAGAIVTVRTLRHLKEEYKLEAIEFAGGAAEGAHIPLDEFLPEEVPSTEVPA
ncbi:hypothetical protein M426DRAFT_17009 [Hypoxylon sp. CI-4A]|nr:hypothetical protein M426DRAFT_17009 [Hypoxylon sp. CI-4A]